MKAYWIRVHAIGIITRRKTETQKKNAIDKGGRDWSDASTTQTMSKIASNHQKLRKSNEGSSLKLSEREWPI